MEAAAKQVRLLTQRVLPEHPHHLSYDPRRRYPGVPDGRGFEEQIHRGLQYMTFVSDGDRGVLLTRPYYDMREEPPAPKAHAGAAAAAATPSRMEKKPSTKMSLSDYKNKVKQQSQSPLNPNSVPKRTPAETPARPLAPPDRRPDRPPQSDPRRRDGVPPSKEPPKSLLSSARPSSLPPKPPPSVHPPTISPKARKRISDEDDARPTKRSKLDYNNNSHDRIRPPPPPVPRELPPRDLPPREPPRPRDRDDQLRRKDMPSTSTSREKTSRRSPPPPPRPDNKSSTTATSSSSSSNVNGRGLLKPTKNHAQASSPNARSRGTASSINGIRPPSSSGSKTVASTKSSSSTTSATTKSAVPPLLSPLHISFNDPDPPAPPVKKAEKPSRRDEPTRRDERREESRRDDNRREEYSRREDNSDPRRKDATSKSKSSSRSLAPPPPPPKKTKPPFALPPLLSPTLPPLIEAELKRRKRPPTRDLAVKSPEATTKTLKKSTTAGKTAPEEGKRKRERLIVTLKIPRRLIKRVQRLTALPSKNDRPGSMDPPAQSQTAPSKKRPLPSSNSAEATRNTPSPSAPKRHKKLESTSSASASASASTSTSAKPAPPSTPSRSSVSASHVDTPGEAGSAGPSSSHGGGSQVSTMPTAAANKLRLLSDRYGTFGKKLKRARDGIFRNLGVNSAAAHQIPEPDQKLAIVTGIEAILAFMIGFKALFEMRRGERKPPDPMPWRSLLPMVGELQWHARAYNFPHTLLWMLQDIIMQEILACYYLSDLRNPTNAQELQRMGALQVNNKKQMPALYRLIEEAGEERRLPVLNPGASFEEVVARSLEAVKRWAKSEDVNWRATLSPEDVLAGN